jgi:uncharacterized protein
MTLKTYINDTNCGGFINVKLTPSCTKKITKILEDLGIKDFIDDFHITLMYDKSNPAISVKMKKGEYKTTITGIDVMGEPDSKWYAVVLKLESDELTDRHNQLKRLGFTHSYPQFKMHVSLKYKPTPDDIETIKFHKDKFMEIGELLFDSETRKLLKDD